MVSHRLNSTTALHVLRGRWHVLLVAAGARILYRLPLAWVAPALARIRGHSPPPAHYDRNGLVSYVDGIIDSAPTWVSRGCLVRATTRWYFLRRAGVRTQLKFGINTATGFGHCWIEIEGAPVAERRDPRSLFVEMFALDPPLAAR